MAPLLSLTHSYYLFFMTDIDKKIEEYQAKRQKIQKEANGSSKVSCVICDNINIIVL